MAFDFSQFITEYFVNPIKYPETYAPYNAVNTLVFAIVAIIAVYFIYKFLNKHGVKTDEKFYLAIIPFIFFGSIMRVLSDAEVLPRLVEIAGITFYPFITPAIYLLIFVITISALLIARTFENWLNLFSIFGWALALLSILPLVFLFKNFILFAAILAIVAVIALFLWFAPFKTNAMEKGIVLSQVFDGAATFVGVQFGGYGEQHVVGNLIFDLFGGPWAFLVVKLLFALVVVYVLRNQHKRSLCLSHKRFFCVCAQESEKSAKVEEIAFVSLIITIFGLAPGTRDALRLLAGV